MMQVPTWWDADVSRETLDKLQAYADLLRKWDAENQLDIEVNGFRNRNTPHLGWRPGIFGANGYLG